MRPQMVRSPLGGRRSPGAQARDVAGGNETAPVSASFPPVVRQGPACGVATARTQVTPNLSLSMP